MTLMMITDLRHFLDERGCIAPREGPALRLAEFLTSIVASITNVEGPMVPVGCRRRPGRKPCPGVLDIQFDEDLEIFWICPKCLDEGIIRGWQESFWDLLFSPEGEGAPG